MGNKEEQVVTLFAYTLYLIAWVLAITLSVNEAGHLAKELVRYLLLFSVGFHGIMAFFKLYFFPDKKHTDGRHDGVVLSKQVSMAFLAFGFLGILSYWCETLWIATALGISLFFLGNTYVFIQERVEKKETRSHFPVPMIALHILIPLTLWIGMLLYYA